MMIFKTINFLYRQDNIRRKAYKWITRGFNPMLQAKRSSEKKDLSLSHKKQILATAFVIFAFLLSSCDNTDRIYVPEDEITASETNLLPDKMTKTVSTTLSFKNLASIDYLSVKKSGGDNYSVKINQSELSQAYRFNYAIQSSDPESFVLRLQAYYRDGNASNILSLSIDNRWGFFIRKVTRIARVTGTRMVGETFPSPNNTAGRWNVGGTDLGIVWEIQPGKYGIFFGDTFGRDFVPNASSPGPNGGSWRSNVLAFSEDTHLDDGLAFNGMATDNRGDAREIIYGGKDGSGAGNWTSIPTAAIHAGDADYVHYFNIRNWTGWVTNYSGMYKSLDKGQTWVKCENISFPSNSYFGMAGYFKKDGYVYMIGTPSGRDGSARLARFRESDIEDREKYEYWADASNQWIQGDETGAVIIIRDKAGELSFLYNDTLKKWIIAYFNADRYNITMRTAEEITGPWSDPYELAAGAEYAQLYGSYFHPVSVSGNTLYFLMSMWMPYNVFLMKAELADMGNFSN